jgi:hypothetical protein
LQRENPKAAFCLSDFCHTVLQVTQNTVFLTAGYLVGKKLAPLVDAQAWLKLPGRMLATSSLNLLGSTVSLIGNAALMLGEATLAYVRNPEAFKKNAQEALDNADPFQVGFLIGSLSGSAPVSRFAQRKMQLAKVNLNGVFQKAIEYQKAPLEAFKKIKDRIDDVKSFFEPLGTIKTKADEYIWQVKKIVTYKNLSKLIKIAKPSKQNRNGITTYLEHQREVTLKNGIKVIFRRDFGKYAHPLKKSSGFTSGQDIDHYNVEIHVSYRGTQFEKIYDTHIVPHPIIDQIKQFDGIIDKNLDTFR